MAYGSAFVPKNFKYVRRAALLNSYWAHHLLGALTERGRLGKAYSIFAESVRVLKQQVADVPLLFFEVLELVRFPVSARVVPVSRLRSTTVLRLLPVMWQYKQACRMVARLVKRVSANASYTRYSKSAAARFTSGLLSTRSNVETSALMLERIKFLDTIKSGWSLGHFRWRRGAKVARRRRHAQTLKSLAAITYADKLSAICDWTTAVFIDSRRNGVGLSTRRVPQAAVATLHMGTKRRDQLRAARLFVFKQRVVRKGNESTQADAEAVSANHYLRQFTSGGSLVDYWSSASSENKTSLVNFSRNSVEHKTAIKMSRNFPESVYLSSYRDAKEFEGRFDQELQFTKRVTRRLLRRRSQSASAKTSSLISNLTCTRTASRGLRCQQSDSTYSLALRSAHLVGLNESTETRLWAREMRRLAARRYTAGLNNLNVISQRRTALSVFAKLAYRR